MPGSRVNTNYHIHWVLHTPSTVYTVYCIIPRSTVSRSHISNNPSFHLKHPGVPDGSDGSGGTSYPLTGIRHHQSPKRRVALHTSLAAAILPCLVFLRRVAFYVTLATPASGFLYFEPGMWWRIRTIRMTRMLHSSQGLQLCSSHLHNAWRCLCLSSADSHMLHSHLCLALRFCHLLQYSLRFGYIACCCICFAIIVFSMSEIYRPIFTLSNTMPSVLHILRWSIIGLRCFFLLICIRIIAILAPIPVDITGSQIKPLELSRGPSSPAGGGNGITFITCIFEMPAATWHPEMQFVMRVIVVYRDVVVSASDLRFLKRHFWGQIVKKNSIVNMRCFHADHHGRR